MLQTSVNTWLYSSCCHCPFWFPLVFFPWDQGDLFLVQGLVKWGVAIVTDTDTNWVPLQILELGKEHSLKWGSSWETLLSLGGIKNCPGLSGWCLMHLKQPEGCQGTCCMKHTHLSASVGPVNVLGLVFSFAVVPFSKSAAQIHPPRSPSALECSWKLEQFCACVENWMGKYVQPQYLQLWLSLQLNKGASQKC